MDLVPGGGPEDVPGPANWNTRRRPEGHLLGAPDAAGRPCLQAGGVRPAGPRVASCSYGLTSTVCTERHGRSGRKSLVTCCCSRSRGCRQARVIVPESESPSLHHRPKRPVALPYAAHPAGPGSAASVAREQQQPPPSLTLLPGVTSSRACARSPPGRETSSTAERRTAQRRYEGCLTAPCHVGTMVPERHSRPSSTCRSKGSPSFSRCRGARPAVALVAVWTKRAGRQEYSAQAD